MNTAKEIAQWVIDNRFAKSENDKVTDFEMFHILVEKIHKVEFDSYKVGFDSATQSIVEANKVVQSKQLNP